MRACDNHGMSNCHMCALERWQRQRLLLGLLRIWAPFLIYSLAVGLACLAGVLSVLRAP
jgi:O-antigen ligase